jgi:hypothetical protein
MPKLICEINCTENGNLEHQLTTLTKQYDEKLYVDLRITKSLSQDELVQLLAFIQNEKPLPYPRLS